MSDQSPYAPDDPAATYDRLVAAYTTAEQRYFQHAGFWARFRSPVEQWELAEAAATACTEVTTWLITAGIAAEYTINQWQRRATAWHTIVTYHRYRQGKLRLLPSRRKES